MSKSCGIAREWIATPSIGPVTALEVLVAIGQSALVGAVLLALRVLVQTGDSLANAWAEANPMLQ